MNNRDWLIWYRNWLCQEHQPAAISTHSVVDALDRQLGFSGSRAADPALADVGMATRDKAPHLNPQEIKPQAERDDWWTTRIDPYDDRIRALERWVNLNTVDICDSKQPPVDPDLPHPYGAAYDDVVTKGTGAVRLSYKDGVMKTEHVPRGLFNGPAPEHEFGSSRQHTPAAPTHARTTPRTAGGPYLTAADVLGRPSKGELVADILNNPLAAPEPP